MEAARLEYSICCQIKGSKNILPVATLLQMPEAIHAMTLPIAVYTSAVSGSCGTGYTHSPFQGLHSFTCGSPRCRRTQLPSHAAAAARGASRHLRGDSIGSNFTSFSAPTWGCVFVDRQPKRSSDSSCENAGLLR